MELIPRISRAQSMDALSSQASISGYQAVLMAATYLDKYFPLLMTAAGTIQPAKIVIMGAGVAGLQAIATARRLGAVVEVSDIRPAVKEQVESLGGRFIDFPMDESGEGEGGYARELTPEQLKAQQADRPSEGRRCRRRDHHGAGARTPRAEAHHRRIWSRRCAKAPSSSIWPSNRAATASSRSSGEMVPSNHGVTIIGHPNLPASTPADASLLYSRNILALLLGTCCPRERSS